MNKLKRRQTLIALTTAFLLIAILAAFLFFITLQVFPEVTPTARTILSILGAAIIGAASFFSGLKDAFDFVLNILDRILSKDPRKEPLEDHKTVSNFEHLSEGANIPSQGNVVGSRYTHDLEKESSGISTNLHSQLRTALLDCGPFATDRELQAVFVDKRVSPWRTRLPQADNIVARVEKVIDFLHNQHNDVGENALVLFLYVLSERLDPKDACHQRLVNIAKELEREIASRNESNLGGRKQIYPQNPISSVGHSTSMGGNANIQAHNIAGRDINIFNIAPPIDSQTTFSVLSNQINKLGESLSAQAQQRLVTLRNAWREGRNQETLYALQKLRQDSDHWAALSNEVKAEYLCFEGSIELHLGNVRVAKEFADEANTLASISNEARLRALIALKEGKVDEAIRILTGWDDLDSLLLKATLYLELQKPVQCRQILEPVLVSSNPSAETFRLLALSYLVTKEINQAQLEIQKALELNPLWESVRFSAMLIDFYSALSLAAFDDPIVISPEPISWTLIKCDDESLSKLSQAADRLQELMKLKERTQEEVNWHHVWYLACLANHPERQSEATQYCQSLLKRNPAFTPAIRWALARTYEFDLDASVTALEEYVVNDTASIYHILALIDCYIAGQRLDEAIELLEQKENEFHEQGATETWLHAFAQVQVSNGSPEVALLKINSYEQNPKAYHARMLVLHSFAQETNDWQALYDFLNEIYAETHDPNVLLHLCEVRATQQDWLYIAENSRTLFGYFETAEVLRLAAIAAFNTGDFQLCLRLLNDNLHLFPKSKLPPQLRRMHILCQREMGILPQAILDAEDLASEIPTLENFIPLINLYVMKGDFKRLVLTAHQLESFPNLPPEIFLWVSRLLIWEDRELALSLWRKATKEELPDELVGEAFFLGNQLGLKTELKHLSLKLQQLGREGRGGILSGPAHELLEIVGKSREHGTTVNEAYRAGRVPIHFVSQELNVSLATLYHSRLIENENVSDLSKKPPLLARHGGRIPAEGFPTHVSNLNIYLDITSILLAEHLEILSTVEQAFAPLHISAELVPALIQLREQITPHQPTRFEEHKQIVALVDNGAIIILDEELSSEFDNPTLLAEMGREWVILAETAIKTNGFLVDYLPLTKRDLSGTPPSAVPEDIHKLLVNCRALVESLFREGPLSKEDYHKTLEKLGFQGQVEPSKTVPPQGSILYCYGAIPETLAGADLLTILCQRFRVHISNQIYERIKADYEGYLYMRSLADWVDNLISRLNRGLERQLYRITPISPDKTKQIEAIRSEHPLDGVLAFLLGFDRQDSDVIWTDDRWLNSHRHRDGIPIADVYDILKLLVSVNQTTKAQYYQLLHRLRSGNVIFIPIQRDEIVYHLRQTQIDPTMGTVIETLQLRVLRQYAASCLLQKTIIQTPPMPPGSPNEQGEITFVLNFVRGVSWALFDIWQDSSIDEERRPILCEWIINNLYLDYLTLFRAVSLPIEEEAQIYHATLGLFTLLVAPFSMPISFSDIEIASRKAYFSWLYKRLLQKRFSADPHLLTSTLEMLKDTFNRVREDTRQGEVDLTTVNSILQTYFDVLPEPIQEELHNDAEFMSSVGLEFIPVVLINDLAFEPREFFSAAGQAINGQKTMINPVQSDIEITFESIENEVALKFVDPNTGEETRVIDERFVLLLDSTIKREQMLYQRKNWFDCSNIELREAITSILVTEDILRRIEIAEQWRENSPYLYYKNLYEKIREQKQIHFPDLIPPSAGRLISHYRFSQAMGVGVAFLEEFAVASKTLLDEEGLGTTVHRLAGFPISLPKSILDEISSLSDPDLFAFVRNLLKSAGSPLSKIHLVKILVQVAERKPSFCRLARRIIKSLFTGKSISEFIAFSKLLRWVHQEFAYWNETDGWQPHIHLAMVWAHTHQLFSIFMAVSIPSEWIAETFERSIRRLPTEVFNRDSSQWFDVAHPRKLNFPVFVLMGIADSVGQKGSMVFDQTLQAFFMQVGYQQIDDLILPTGPFLTDNKRATNTLGAFMGGSYYEKLNNVFGEELIANFRDAEYESIAFQAITSLIENPYDFSSWIPLQIIIGDLPLYGSLHERLTQLFAQTSFVGLLNNHIGNGLATMQFAAWQLTHLSNEELNKHLKIQFGKVLEHLATTLKPDNPNMAFLSRELIEIILNIALCSQTINETALELRGLLLQTAKSLPETKPFIRTMVQVMCEELPMEQSQHLGALLLSLRAG